MEWINRLLGGKSDTHLEKLNPTGEVTIPNAAQLQVILSRAVVYMAQVRSEEHVQGMSLCMCLNSRVEQSWFPLR